MKFLVVLALTCMVLALTANAYGLQEDLDAPDHQDEERNVKSKFAETSTSKLAAKMCKPFFVSCKQNVAEKTDLKRCFVQFFTGCMQKIRTQLVEMEKCIFNAGNDFNQVQDCVSPSAKY